MRTKLSTIEDMQVVDFIALWLAVKSLYFFVHKNYQLGFTPDAISQHQYAFIPYKHGTDLIN
jgi:hypothetical protein